MFCIGICDGSARHRAELERLLTLALFDVTEFRFAHYSDGFEILEALERGSFNVDLLFIDIALPRLNGLKTVAVLRQRRCAADIIFLTELEKYVYEGYVYHAYDFLVKPASAKTIGRVMQRYAEERLCSRRRYMTVNVQGCAQKIGLDNVYYFESRKRKVAAISPSGEAEFYQRMDELYEKIAPAGFVRCHQSYIVNKKRVAALLPTGVLMQNGVEIPLSKSYLKDIREQFHKE